MLENVVAVSLTRRKPSLFSFLKTAFMLFDVEQKGMLHFFAVYILRCFFQNKKAKMGFLTVRLHFVERSVVSWWRYWHFSSDRYTANKLHLN